jgi:hypothetical protein
MSLFQKPVPRSLQRCLLALIIFAFSSITVAQAQANGEPFVGVPLPKLESTPQIVDVADSGSLWPGGVVYYQINNGSTNLTTAINTFNADSGSSSTHNSATGSAPVTVSQAIGSCTTSNPNPNPNPESFAAVGDFNGDCRSDILWRNSSTQQVYIWLMNGTTYPGSGSPGSPTSDWVIQSVGDFDGDGMADILWRNSTTGEVYIWLMNGTTTASSGSLGYVSSDWSIQGVGDFNGDGNADILWRNSSTGEVYLWLMNGTTQTGGGSLGIVSTAWSIVGVGDFNGDGKADILWRNSSSGEVYLRLMNGTTIASQGSLGTVNSAWTIQGVGDFNGDGKSDILWRNSSSGEVYLWFMNGTATASSGSLGVVSSAWVIQGVGDYDGSGRAGILWRNSTTEQVYIWLMNGTTQTGGGSLGTPSTVWQIAPLTVKTAVAAPGIDVTTYHFDIGRTGLNPNETTLTSSNVTSSKFGLLHLLAVDGSVDAQPLYLSNLTAGGQQRNVVYAVTEHDSVYAFDADTGTQIWKTSALGANETTSGDHGCGQISPEIGITSTPVIDRTAGPNGTIFVVGMTLDQSGAYHQRLHALDVTTGAELPGSPTEIQAMYPGTGENSSGGNVVFDPGQYAERVGLLLMNGTIYLGWTSHCDIDPYTGWLMAYSESTLAQTSVLNLTPNGSEGSIWMAGTGLAADSSGNIYFLDANGTFDGTLNANGLPVKNDFGNAFLKISTTGGSLAVADYFEAYNGISESNADEDLGSGGALVLPDLTDSSGTVHHLAVGAGKDQNIYVVNRDSMGKYSAQNNNALYQEIDAPIGGVWSMPAYFNNTIYYGAVSDTLKAFPIVNAKLATSASVKSANTFAYPGTTPAVSANGTTNGIVWAVENSSPAVLHAFDATTLKELYNSNQAANNRDHFGSGNKFITPMEVNGMVFVGTPNAVAVFGLLP